MRVISGHSRTMSGNDPKMSGKDLKCPEWRGYPTLGLPQRDYRYGTGRCRRPGRVCVWTPALGLSNKISIRNR